MAEFYVQTCSHSDPGAALAVFREVPISHEAHHLGCSGTSNPTLEQKFMTTGSALRGLNDAQIDQFPVEGHRAIDRT